MNRLAMALGYADAESDPKGHAEARKYAASVLAEVEKSAGAKKNDLTLCQPESIAQSMIDAAKFRLEIDGRQHAHLIAYAGKATFQIGYRGFISKIAEFYQDVDYSDGAIYEGDEFEISEKDGFAEYTLKRGNPFAPESALVGVFVAISYTKGNRQFQKIATMNKAEIQKVRNCAKQDYIWKAWYIEKALVACIKRVSKKQFQTVSGLQEMVRYDNDSNFILSDKAFDKKEQDSITDNLNKQIAAEIPQGPKDAIDVEISDAETSPVIQGSPSASDEEPAANPPTEGVALQLHLSSGEPLAFDSSQEMVGWIVENAKFTDLKQLEEFKSRNSAVFEHLGPPRVATELKLYLNDIKANIKKESDGKAA